MIRPIIAALVLALLPVQPLVAKAPPSEAAAQTERMIALEGGRNFRDVGGYRTADGHLVRWNVLYRSGSLGSLAPEGMTRLGQLDIRGIIDLRTTDERRRDSSNWLAAAGLGYWTHDYQLGGDNGAFALMLQHPESLKASDVRAMMIGGYRVLPKLLIPQYRELFAQLSAPGKGAVVVNCTAGKDRTGIATALVLTALGVPYETVREDFLLSNNALGMQGLSGAISPHLAKLPPDVVQPLLEVDGEYLDAAFDQLRMDYGSVENYLAKELGVGSAQLVALKRRMLVRR
jgi:protein-tyrosine phosphatase